MVKKIQGYSLLENVGKGEYGQVFKATHQSNPGFFAIKVIPNDTLVDNPKLEQCLLNEVKILSKIGRCDNIVRFYELIRTKNNHYFVYDFCNGKTLFDRIRGNIKIPENQALKYFKEILSAFKILNKYKVIHRDLKPQNILFHNHQIKVADFGLCKGLKQEQSMTKTMVGSPIYMAPQVLKSQPYTSKADIWSLGVILFQMLYGYCPYQSHSIAQLTNKIQQTTFSFPQNPQVSQKTKSTIRQMLTKDHFRRIGWVQLFGEYCEEKQNRNIHHPKHHPSLCMISEKNSSFAPIIERHQSQKQNKNCFNSARYMKQLEDDSTSFSPILLLNFHTRLETLHRKFLQAKDHCQISLISHNIKEVQCIIELMKEIRVKLQDADTFLQQNLKNKIKNFQDLQTMIKYQIIGLNQCIQLFTKTLSTLQKSTLNKMAPNFEEYDRICLQIRKINFNEK